MRWSCLLLGAMLILSLAKPTAAAEATPVACLPVFFVDAGDVECFEVVVPERYEAPNSGRRITLFVSIVRATSATPEPDPVVFLSGGPGSPAADLATYFATSSIRATRDIILVEQRGTALTDPFLGCPALDQQEAIFGANPMTEGLFREFVGEAAASCAAAYDADGVDLAAYTTAASAEDLELIRQALGIASWNLYGVSYGTRLGLEVLRRHPESVRAAVFDSVDPPHLERYVNRTPDLADAFDAASAACTAVASCASRFGDLGVLLARALERWRDEPATVFARFTHDSYTDVLVDHGAVASLVYSTLVSDPSGLPLLLEQLAEGRTTILELSDLRPGLNSEGVRLSIECSESVSRVDASEISANDATNPDLALAFRRFPEAVACLRWPMATIDEAFFQPVASDVPVLLVSGAFDPITPPSSADEAARTLSAARHHVVPGGGHGAGFADACAIEVRDAFLADPAASPYACDSPMAFLTDVVAHDGLAGAWRAVFAPAPPQIGSLLLAIVVTAIALSVVFLGAIVALVGGSRSTAVRALTITAAAMLGLGALIGWAWMTNPTLVGMIGMPSILAWLPLAATGVVGLGIVTIVLLAIEAFKGGRRLHRLLMMAAMVPVAGGVWLLIANVLAG